MFKTTRPRSSLHSAINIAELIYHAAVRDVRKSDGNAIMALLKNIMTVIIMVMAFYLMFSVLGLKGNALRGDFLLFMMSGIFVYITHIKAMSAVIGAEGPASPMMQHAPMNTVIAICSPRSARSIFRFCRFLWFFLSITWALFRSASTSPFRPLG